MSSIQALYAGFLRHFTIRLVAFVAAFAVALPALPVTGFGTGIAEAGQKRGGGAKAHRGGGMRKMRVNRSGGHRVARSSGVAHKGGMRTVRMSAKSGHRKLGKDGVKSARTYNVRRSVLNGHGYAKGMARGMGSVRKGKMHNVKRYGVKQHAKRGGGQYKTSERRSGVRLSRTTNVTTTSVTGLREVAGSRSTVKKTRLGDVRRHNGHKGGRHIARSFTASGALVVVVEGGHSHGLEEVAGNGGGLTDCAYGSYCTIDLGGPKIITFNDVGDISGGNIADENLTDEEFNEKYGGK